ncbi:MAG: hypothetical protein RLZZ612_647 [Pseudomonadota bacterium]
MTKSRSDIDPDYFRYGFRRSEIARFLQGKGIVLASSGKAEIQPAKPVPEWANRLKPIKEFSLFQAADVLLGRDPFVDGQYWNWHQDSAFVAYVRALGQAADCGDLPFVREFENSQYTNNNYEFKHDDLRRWANAHGFDWCIPESPAFINRPQTNAELLKQFQDVTSKNTTLGQEVERLQKQLQHHQDQTKTLTENAKLIGELQAENERLKEENKCLTDEIGSGKGKNTMLKMIAGMAIKGYAIDIHSQRMSGISDLANDLADCGVQLDHKTISDRLKEAAQQVAPPKK